MAESNEKEAIPAPPSEEYVPDEVILYGVSLNQPTRGEAEASLRIGTDRKNKEIVINIKLAGDHQKTFEIAAIYGYAYEGHCYRMDKPKILVFEAAANTPKAASPAVGCGFGKEYSMWRVRSPHELVEFDMTVGTAQTVILDANLPGRRAPSTYSANMQVAHRGGRLT